MKVVSAENRHQQQINELKEIKTYEKSYFTEHLFSKKKNTLRFFVSLFSIFFESVVRDCTVKNIHDI